MDSEVKSSVLDVIGETPVVRLGRLFPKASVVAKLEFMNPGGSIQDRTVRHLLKRLPAGTRRVVDSSCGDAGAALAMAGAVLGLACDVALPETTSRDKVRRIRAYGAEAHLCAPDGVDDAALGYRAVGAGLAQATGAHLLEHDGSALAREAHYLDTGPELWRQLAGEIDVFVCALGSGAAISGVGRYLKERDPGIRVVGVSAERPEGGYDTAVVDQVLQVADADALSWRRRLATREGILAGSASGCVAAGIARLLPGLAGERIATLFPDSGVSWLAGGV